jgi:hypothetical protein
LENSHSRRAVVSFRPWPTDAATGTGHAPAVDGIEVLDRRDAVPGVMVANVKTEAGA